MENRAFDFTSDYLSFHVEGKGNSGKGAKAFSFEKAGEIAILAKEECVVMLASGGHVAAGKYTKADGLKDKIEEDFRSYFTATEEKPGESHAVVFAGKTFTHIEAEAGDYETLERLGYLEAGKITGGVDYVDLPVLALLSLRKLGLKTENIEVLPYDVAEFPDTLYREKDEGYNRFVLIRK